VDSGELDMRFIKSFLIGCLFRTGIGRLDAFQDNMRFCNGLGGPVGPTIPLVWTLPN
jgi:hypothetical protein